MKKITAFVVSLTPIVAFAQTPQMTDVNSLSSKLVNIGNLITYLLIAMSVIAIPIGIIVGIVLAVRASDEQDISKKKRKKWWMIICFIAPIVLLFVVLSGWGLINILLNTFKN
ncbi:MAG: hypothetical protein WCG02_02805 [Candidatus Taylorbacteria bacterium]